MVSTSLFTGLSGLRAQQRYIDVIGNNLANVSTPGFWASRMTFGDILSFTMRSGSGPSAQFGGQNPMQVGLGTEIASIDVNTEQGTFQNTGRSLDVAIQGRGFFTLTDGIRTYYTRVGTFGLDSSRTLVDLRSGYRVQGASGANITVPLTDTLPPQQTGEITFQGNLPARVTGPLEEILESSAPFLQGTAATQTGAPPSGTTYDVSSFLNRTLLVAVNGGAQQTVTLAPSAFANPAAATGAEVQALFAGISGITTSLSAGTGAVTLQTVRLGTSSTLKLDDGPNAAGLLQALGLNASLQTGTETAATAATDLNQLTQRSTPYVAGDQITVAGTNPDGSAVSDTFVYGTTGTTLGDLLDFINDTYDSAQVSGTITSTGAIRLTATQKQPASLSLVLSDAPSNTGASSFPSMSTIQEGEGPDTATTSIDVVDALGRTHSVTLTFQRSTLDPSSWDLTASIDPTDGVVASGQVSSIRFNQDGSFNVVGGGTNSLSFQFNGINTTQNVTVNLGTSGSFNGVSMVGDNTTVAATGQDGFVAGQLLNVAFEAAGRLQGFYTNGQTRTLDTLRLTVFPNEAGLLRQGDTLFTASPNSEDPIATTAGAAGAGVIRAGALENSNVDIAEEFVKMITAQRGFQANSRVITTADEILAELVNIIR
jgi:flagellar hook protein FlgE